MEAGQRRERGSEVGKKGGGREEGGRREGGEGGEREEGGRREGGGREERGRGKDAAEWRTDGDKEMKRIEREFALPAASAHLQGRS